MRRKFTRLCVTLSLLVGVWGVWPTLGQPTTQATLPTTQATRPTTQATRPVQYGPIRVEPVFREVDGKPIRGWAAKIDLADPRVEIRVTGPAERKPDDPQRLEARCETTPDWLKRENLTLAINAHFFARLDDGRGPYWEGCPVDLIGPCVSDGRLVSGGRTDGRPSPVLAISRDRRARVAMLSPAEWEGADDVISGVSESGGKSGGLLVEDGRNRGEDALPAPQVRHPRTAAGVSRDGRTLILAVVDGRQPEWSIGMTLPELADLMISLGAEAAINLDGGGSSSFVFRMPDGREITNRPSDGRWRPVGSSLGVYLRSSP